MEQREFQGLHNLIAPMGARKKMKRVGRGESSGYGKTSTRGHKGQKARKSGNVRIGFEGGQIPFERRVPKRGFSNALHKKTYQPVNLELLSKHFKAGDTIDHAALLGCGLASKSTGLVKILGGTEVGAALNLKVHAISKNARQKIEEAGGKVEIIG